MTGQKGVSSWAAGGLAMVPQRITLPLGEELAEIMAHSQPHFLCPNDLDLEDMNWDQLAELQSLLSFLIVHCCQLFATRICP